MRKGIQERGIIMIYAYRLHAAGAGKLSHAMETNTPRSAGRSG